MLKFSSCERGGRVSVEVRVCARAERAKRRKEEIGGEEQML